MAIGRKDGRCKSNQARKVGNKWRCVSPSDLKAWNKKYKRSSKARRSVAVCSGKGEGWMHGPRCRAKAGGKDGGRFTYADYCSRC